MSEAHAREVERLVDDAGRSLALPWTAEERTEAVAEAVALTRLLEIVWSYPLPDATEGWRPGP